MSEKSKLVRMEIFNIGCIGPEGLIVELDDMLCLVGQNNSGKSTVLRAYELVFGNQKIDEHDKCTRSKNEENPQVILYVHIPEGMANISERWKFKEDKLLLVKSKWEWVNGRHNRQTFDPAKKDYSDEKASGLDNVFNSRLPIPFRIGTLDDPNREYATLLKLILEPISRGLKTLIEDESSTLFKAITEVKKLARRPIDNEKKNLEKIKKEINDSHKKIFPNLDVDLNLDIGDLQIDPMKLLVENSSLKFREWSEEIEWDKQGTGSQRALFWAMMQVRSEFKRIEENKKSIKKKEEELKKKIQKLKKSLKTAKKEETKDEKNKELRDSEDRLKLLRNGVDQDVNEIDCQVVLPGYMLLIDEPEVALHPNAVRAACDHLYSLSKDDSWQVMLTTHSPAFINPLEDHTTIVRLDRDQKEPTPKTYRCDSKIFTTIEKENLKLLNRFDLNLSEVFFGGYPIIVEGDTEFAAFEHIMENEKEVYPTAQRPIIMRAHGKYTILSIIKILVHFKLNFSVLHDADFPFRKDGKRNSAWEANLKIFEAIQSARTKGLNVIHRISLPYFELAHSIPKVVNGEIINNDSKEKPWLMLKMMKANKDCYDSVFRMLDTLKNEKSEQNPFGERFLNKIEGNLKDWATEHAVKDGRIF